jgi:arylsulfatase A-like enzyme
MNTKARLKTKIKLSVFTILSLYCITSCIYPIKETNPPNIIVLFVDDLGYYDVGFRNPKYFTPNIDQLAKESVTFSNAYVPSPTCSPSRVGLYTGKHPASIEFYRHCIGSNEEYNMFSEDVAKLPSRNWLPLEHITYAEALKDKGYTTFFCGKWHLGGEEYGPQQQGFDITYTNAHAGHPKSYYPPYYEDGKFSNEVENDKYLTDFFTDKAVDFIKSNSNKKPFLLQFSYQNVHAPNVGKKEFLELYKERGFNGKMIDYGAQISAVDQSVGRILKTLHEAGLEENTIVLFLSDQGSQFPNTPLRGTKQLGTALCEGSAKIPYLFKWPGNAKAGTTNEIHVQTTDIFPTLIEIVGGDPSNYKGLEGKSLYHTLKSNKPLKREALFFYRSYDGQYASVLREDNWKLIAYRDGHYELFNLETDISEENDMSKKKPIIVKELSGLLRKWELKNGILQ